MCRTVLYMLRVLFISFLIIGPIKLSWSQDSVQETITIDSSSRNSNEDQNNEHFDKAGSITQLQSRPVPDSVIRKLKNDDDFWYVNLAPVKEKNQEHPVMNFHWLKTVIWIIILGSFIAILILFLSASNIGLFRKKAKNIKSDREEFAQSENIFELDFNKAIASAIGQRDFPLAIRFYYLHTLKMLADRQLIQYSLQKTNSDYIAQLHNTDYYRDFFHLTRQFEYVWYGQLPVSEIRFNSIESDFKNFKLRLAA